MHPLTRLFYAWAWMFAVPTCETFEVAANKFGRLRRSWPEAVFLQRELAQQLAVPFAQEPGMGECLELLLARSTGPLQPLDVGIGPDQPLLEFLFRTPSQVALYRRAQENQFLLRRALVPSVWCGGVIRAYRYFYMKRWFQALPLWSNTFGVVIEPAH